MKQLGFLLALGLCAISGTAATTLNDFYDGLEFGMVGLLTSPNFIYRVELGEPNPAAGSSEEEAALRFSSMEMASRLSYFLWNSTPDDTLLAAAEAGELEQPEAPRTRTIDLREVAAPAER